MSDPYNGQSVKQTAFAVLCPKHGQVFLTSGEYHRQLMNADDRWACPVMDADINEIGLCGRISEFDDDNFDEMEAAQ